MNIANPATGAQKKVEIDDDAKLRAVYDKRIAQEVEGDALGEVRTTFDTRRTIEHLRTYCSWDRMLLLLSSTTHVQLKRRLTRKVRLLLRYVAGIQGLRLQDQGRAGQGRLSHETRCAGAIPRPPSSKQGRSVLPWSRKARWRT